MSDFCPTAQRLIQMQALIAWNRAQKEPPIRPGYEATVLEAVVRVLVERQRRGSALLFDDVDEFGAAQLSDAKGSP